MDGASGIRAPRTLGIPVRVPSNTLQLKLRVDVPLSPVIWIWFLDASGH